jgi:hypothetical protein
MILGLSTGLALAVAAPAWAQSEDPSEGDAPEPVSDPEASYQATPSSSWGADVGTPQAAAGKLIVTATEATKALSAKDLCALVDVIATDGPNGRGGWTVVTPSWDADGNVTLAIAVTVVGWTERAQALAAQRAEFDRYVAAVRAHEKDHEAIARDVYAGLPKAIQGKTRDEVVALVAEYQAKEKVRQDKLDADSAHGANDRKAKLNATDCPEP